MNGIEKKITLSFSAISLAFLVMTIITFIQVNNLTKSSQYIQHVLEPSVEANLRLTVALYTSITSLQNWVLTRDKKYIRQRKAIWSVIEKKYKQLKNYSKKWNKIEHVELLDNIAKDLKHLQGTQKIIEETIYTANKAEALRILKEELLPFNQQLIKKFRQISDPQNWEMQRVFLQEEQQEQELKNIALIFLILSITFGASLGILLARAVIIPLNRTIKLTDSISKGNYKLGDELYSGEEKLDSALRIMTNQLRKKEKENKNQQMKLEKYNKELERSNEELSQFSYRTSHDLKAPLITVRGLADAIYEDIGDKNYNEAKKNASHISTHVAKLENLVVDILSLAKADLSFENDNEYIDIKLIITEIKSRLESIYIDNDVAIKTNFDHSIRFYTSKTRLTQVLENLISNAIKYSDPNKPKRFVKISTIQNKKNHICIVEDNGIGIPKEFTKRVFDMFQRFHPKISYGSGLGMYIIKKHIDKMEGEISFSSSDQGTKFTIKLPKLIKE